ncbi:MAG: hypothetical protein ACJ8C4_18035 [Gemmataceae bacterium]
MLIGLLQMLFLAFQTAQSAPQTPNEESAPAVEQVADDDSGCDLLEDPTEEVTADSEEAEFVGPPAPEPQPQFVSWIMEMVQQLQHWIDDLLALLTPTPAQPEPASEPAVFEDC